MAFLRAAPAPQSGTLETSPSTDTRIRHSNPTNTCTSVHRTHVFLDFHIFAEFTTVDDMSFQLMHNYQVSRGHISNPHPAIALVEKKFQDLLER